MIGQKIKELRTKKDMSQQDIANIVGKSQQAVNLWEKGDNEPSLETINLLANYFDVTTDYLLGRTDNPFPIKGDKLHTVEEEWPEAVSVLLRAGRKPTITDRRRIAKIMEAAIEYTGEDEVDK